VEEVKKHVHVAQNSGENEWYTPPQFIDAARQAMGAIDTDPASCELAQETVNASLFYTMETDGLSNQWKGRVWLNPPYSKDFVGRFISKLIEESDSKRVSEACVLLNNATDTEWFHKVVPIVSAICFLKGRISFPDSNGDPKNKPLQGQMVLYIGSNVSSFKKSFSSFGVVLRK